MKAFFAGLGAAGMAVFVALWIGMIAGWIFNLWKLFHHLPLMDVETVIRLIGIVPVIGGIVGWF